MIIVVISHSPNSLYFVFPSFFIKILYPKLIPKKLSLIKKFIILDFKRKEHYIKVTAMYQKQTSKMETEQKDSRNLNQIVFCHRRLVSVCLQLENGNLFSLFTITPHFIMIFIFSYQTYSI